jgi:hypothetical protein
VLAARGQVLRHLWEVRHHLQLRPPVQHAREQRHERAGRRIALQEQARACRGRQRRAGVSSESESGRGSVRQARWCRARRTRVRMAH